MPRIDRAEAIATFYRLSPRDCVAVLGNVVEAMLQCQDKTAWALWRQMQAHAARNDKTEVTDAAKTA